MRKHFFKRIHWILLMTSVFVLAFASCTSETKKNDGGIKQLTLAVSKISGPDSYYQKMGALWRFRHSNS